MDDEWEIHDGYRRKGHHVLVGNGKPLAKDWKSSVNPTLSPIVFYRRGVSDPSEYHHICTNLSATEYLLNIPRNSLVVGRYSVLPFYQQLERELDLIGSKLINSYEQHQYIADVMQWAGPGQALEGLTPKTWDHWHTLPQGKYIVKGKTNSRKFSWSRQMFCETVEEIPLVASSLMDDEMISSQGLVVREYVPFKKLMEGLNDLPITIEFRFFVAYGQILSSGYYWSNYVEDIKEQYGSIPDPSMVPQEFIQNVIEKVKDKANFIVIDVGQLEDGSWMVVELNDGQMSGLSENDPQTLYSNLAKVLNEKNVR